MNSRHFDDWTIERWREKPRTSSLEFEEPQSADPAPPLWKDLTLASALALAFWLTAAAIFG